MSKRTLKSVVVTSAEPFNNLGKIALGFNHKLMTTDSNGKEIVAKLFLTDKQMLAIADKALINSTNIKEIARALKGATIEGLQYQKAGDTYIDKDGVEQTCEKNGYRLELETIVINTTVQSQIVDSTVSAMLKQMTTVTYSSKNNVEDDDDDFKPTEQDEKVDLVIEKEPVK